MRSTLAHSISSAAARLHGLQLVAGYSWAHGSVVTPLLLHYHRLNNCKITMEFPKPKANSDMADQQADVGERKQVRTALEAQLQAVPAAHTATTARGAQQGRPCCWQCCAVCCKCPRAHPAECLAALLQCCWPNVKQLQQAVCHTAATRLLARQTLLPDQALGTAPNPCH
jgi:hypothetical protein